MHPEPRRRSRHSRGEKYVLAGGAGQNMIGFSFPACGRGNSARRALPGESIGRKDWMLCREAPTSKAFPSGGRWAGEAGSDEGATLYPTFPCRKGGLSRPSPQRGFSIAPLGNPIAPSSVTFGDSFPPRGSLWVVQPYTKKAPQIRARTWAPYQPHYRSAAPRHAKTSEWERAGPKKGGAGALPRDSLRPGFL